MGRHYAGILGLISFVTITVRGLVGQHSMESTLQVAVISMFAAAGAGFVVGSIASFVTTEAVTARFRDELKQQHEEGGQFNGQLP